MKSMPQTYALASFFLLIFFWAPAAFSAWNMANPIKDLLTKGADQAAQKDTSVQPSPRFKDNGDGSLTDRRTRLIWLKNASCVTFFEGDQSGGKNSRSWHEARVAASRLADGFCGLKDGSQAGDWRLPTREELIEISNDSKNKETWTAGDAFVGLQSFYYWSSTLGDLYQDYAFYVSITSGMDSHAFQLNSFHVLPVREQKRKQP